MGNVQVVARQKAVEEERRKLEEMVKEEGVEFPGSDFETSEHKEWMGKVLGELLSKVKVKDVVWPGTHDSATNKIGIPLVSRPFAQCQSLSPYQQLVKGVRVLDIRVEQEGKVCHGILKSYHVRKVLDDVKRFLGETSSEFVILEVRTEYGYEDPPDFDKFLVEQLGDYLIEQDENAFDRSLADLLPKRVFCVWKPRKSPSPPPGSPLWSSSHLSDHWTDTDLPHTKLLKNLQHLQNQPPSHSRRFFYRVENTCTPQPDNPIVCVKPVTRRIHPFARLFVSQAHKLGFLDRLQIFSSDFVDADFINICIGLTLSRTST